MTDRTLPAVTWMVGSRKCSLTIRPATTPGVMELDIEWTPTLPGRLSPTELHEYIAGRDRAVRWLAAQSPVARPRTHTHEDRTTGAADGLAESPSAKAAHSTGHGARQGRQPASPSPIDQRERKKP